MGLKSRRKGKVFERKVAREFRLRWPDALVRRASQAERAYNPDVFIEGGPALLSSLWLELHDSRNARTNVRKKLAQAERDVNALAQCAPRMPIVIWHQLGERTVQASMRLYVFAWLAYNRVEDGTELVTMDLSSFMDIVERASRRHSAHDRLAEIMT